VGRGEWQPECDSRFRGRAWLGASGRLRFEQLIVCRVVTDPEPLKPVWTLPSKGTIVQTDSGGVKDADFLEPDRRVARIAFEEFKVLVGERADVVWKLPIVEPEVRVCEVVQSGVQRPAS
jgi:hypothetical protein